MAKQLPILSEAQFDVLMDALDDALAYRLGEASGLSDPELDPGDAAMIRRYNGLLNVIAPTGARKEN